MRGVDECLLIKLPARSENLAVVRHAVSNVARQHGMADSRVADLQIVVTEACSNVVVHAYGDRQDRKKAPLEVEASCETTEFGIVVRDSGMGFRSTSAEPESLRLGLALISTLVSSFNVCERREGGTEVSVRLPLVSSGRPDLPG